MAAKNKKPEAPALLTHEMRVETWTLDRIRPYDRNPRKIDQPKIEKLAATLQRFGWRQPIVVDTEGEIVVGTRRYWAAKFLELTEAPVHVASDLTAQQVKEYRLADNKAGEDGEWDDSLLVAELLDLADLGIDVEELGFKALEQKLSGEGPDVGEDDEAEDDDAPGSNDRGIGREGIVNAVFYLTDIPTLEAALKKTGEKNRGRAFAEICAAYLADDDMGLAEL